MLLIAVAAVAGAAARLLGIFPRTAFTAYNKMTTTTIRLFARNEMQVMPGTGRRTAVRFTGGG